MPLYMSQFAYTPEAWAALTRDRREDRNAAVGALTEGMGGRLVAFYHRIPGAHIRGGAEAG